MICARVLRLVRDTPGPTSTTALTGIVADVAIFPDGRAVLCWRTDPRGIEIYDSEAALRGVRERSGRSHLEAP